MRIAVMKQILKVLESIPKINDCDCYEGIGVCSYCHEVESRPHENNCELIAAINALKSEIRTREVCSGASNPDKQG